MCGDLMELHCVQEMECRKMCALLSIYLHFVYARSLSKVHKSVARCMLTLWSCRPGDQAAAVPLTRCMTNALGGVMHALCCVRVKSRRSSRCRLEYEI